MNVRRCKFHTEDPQIIRRPSTKFNLLGDLAPKICALTDVHTHTHTYTCVCVCVWHDNILLYFKKT